MASLTESYLIESTNSNRKNNDSNNIYDTYFLCIQKSKLDSSMIDGFNCYKFSNYSDANKYANKYSDSTQYRSAIIPVEKWIPYAFHNTYINYAIQKVFWKNNITLMRKKN